MLPLGPTSLRGDSPDRETGYTRSNNDEPAATVANRLSTNVTFNVGSRRNFRRLFFKTKNLKTVRTTRTRIQCFQLYSSAGPLPRIFIDHDARWLYSYGLTVYQTHRRDIRLHTPQWQLGQQSALLKWGEKACYTHREVYLPPPHGKVFMIQKFVSSIYN